MDVFEALCLTDGETAVYKALVVLQETTTGPLYREAKVSQSKVYEILDRLHKKGLAAVTQKDGVAHWHPANPHIYLAHFQEEETKLRLRREVLERELPTLSAQQTRNPEEAQVFAGYSGFRTALLSMRETLEEGDEFLVIGSPEPIPEPFAAFLQAFNKERVENKISAKFLYGEKLRDFASSFYDMPLTKVRYMKGLTPSSIAISKDRIIHMMWRDGGKTIVIFGEQLASNYFAFFESLWDMAKN